LSSIREPNCNLCSLNESCEHVCMIGDGPKKARLMIVGEIPTTTDDDRAKVFQGRQGQMIAKLLIQLGIQREEVYLTYAVKCHSPSTPNKTSIKACKPYLMEEIQKVKPEIIVTLGNAALLSVTGRSGIMKYRGEPMVISFGSHKCTVIPTIQPSSIFRNPKNEPLLNADMDRVKAFLAGETMHNNEQSKFKVIIVNTKKKLRLCLEAMEEAYNDPNAYIAYDLETEGKKYLPGKRIWMLGISDRDDRSWVVPIEHPESPWLDKANRVLRKFKKYLEAPWLWKTAHNGKFDDGWMWVRGIKPWLNFDGMLAQHLIDENSPKSLEFLSTVYFKATNWGKGKIQFEYEYNKKGDMIKQPSSLKEMGKYNGIDCIYTRKLYPVLRDKLLEDEKTAKIFKYITMPGSRLLVEVESNGIWVDRKKLGQRYTEACYNANESMEKLEAFVPDNFWDLIGKKKPKGLQTKINWNSTQQVAAFFFGKKKKGGLGLKVIEYTDGGAPSTAEHTMIELEGKHPACDELLVYRKWTKYLNTYIEPWLTFSDNVDWRLHPTFKIWGTVTGRLSSEEPNPQQTPRDKFLRANLGAPPGWTFVEGDYSQIELRVVAFLSGDPRMNRAYLMGEDIHMITACDMLGIEIAEFKRKPKDEQKELRKMAKAVNFGFVYGMWWTKFKKYAKDNYSVTLTDEQAKLYRERFFRLYKGLKPWHDRMLKIVKKIKKVRAPHGRIRHLPDIDSDDEGVSKEAGRQAINSPVQGFASGDLTLLAAILFDKVIKRFFDPSQVRMVLLVHDAIMIEVKNGYEDTIRPILKGVMENTPLMEYFDLNFTVPIIADIQSGQAWGECEEGELKYDRKEVIRMIKEVINNDEELRPGA
jgi:uracil-DNA glycosylase family 4